MMLKNRIMENSSHLKMERRRRRRIEAAAEDRATKKYTYNISTREPERLRQGRFCGAFLSWKTLGSNL